MASEDSKLAQLLVRRVSEMLQTDGAAVAAPSSTTSGVDIAHSCELIACGLDKAVPSTLDEGLASGWCF